MAAPYDGRVAETSELAYTVFPTAWGPVGAVAHGGELTRVVLPHYQADELEAMLRFQHPHTIRRDETFEAFIQGCRAYFNAQAVSFDEIPCRLPGELTFAGKVLRACRAIPYGQTVSYGQLARQIGRPDAPRAVAAALSKNPTPLVVPCHRVTYADGRPGGFSSPAGPALKQRLLDLEAGAADQPR